MMWNIEQRFVFVISTLCHVKIVFHERILFYVFLCFSAYRVFIQLEAIFEV